MSKAYLFAIFLLAASFTGCIGDDEIITEEEETLDAIGEDNMTSLRKEIDDLKATIKSYEKPNVYFMMDDDNDHLFCDDGSGNSCDLMAQAYDVNGVIESYKWESSDPNFDDTDYCLLLLSDDGDKCLAFWSFYIVDVCDYEENQIFTITVYDNDGNSASASYDYVYSEDLCEEAPEPAPIATFFVEESSSGVYHIDVIKVSKQGDLAGFSFFLKDTSGSTYVGGNGFGEIAMQIIGGEEHGIDTSYSGDDDQLKSRAGNVSDDDGSEYPVHFSDNDRDGKLSAGDQFMVYGTGNSASGPAADNWRLDIQFDATGDIIGSAKML